MINIYLAVTRFLICLKPRMAFETSMHPTTQLCLKALEKLDLQKKLVLDIETGSGILSISSIKLGAKAVTACDVDPITIEIAQQNSCQNKVKLISGDVTAIPKHPFDIIIANINIAVLRKSLGLFVPYLGPSSLLILSGILRKDADNFVKSAQCL